MRDDDEADQPTREEEESVDTFTRDMEEDPSRAPSDSDAENLRGG